MLAMAYPVDNYPQPTSYFLFKNKLTCDCEWIFQCLSIY
jgi:hypothetical protein